MQHGPHKHSTVTVWLHIVHFALPIRVLSACGLNLCSGRLDSNAMFFLFIKLHLFLQSNQLLTLLLASARPFFRNRSRAGLYGSTHGEITPFEGELWAPL